MYATVSNTGGATANSVSVTGMNWEVVTAPGSAVYASGPSPAGTVSIAGGSGYTFSWVYIRPIHQE